MKRGLGAKLDLKENKPHLEYADLATAGANCELTHVLDRTCLGEPIQRCIWPKRLDVAHV
jgi:hypothetical protein